MFVQTMKHWPKHSSPPFTGSGARAGYETLIAFAREESARLLSPAFRAALEEQARHLAQQRAVSTPRPSLADRRKQIAGIRERIDFDNRQRAARMTDEDLRGTAFHEAGHCLFDHANGLDVYSVELLPAARPEAAGITYTVRPDKTLCPTIRATQAVVGAEAESKFLGRRVGLTGGDAHAFAAATGADQRWVAYARDRAASFCERRWAAITAFAAELFQRHEIEGDELHALCDKLLGT